MLQLFRVAVVAAALVAACAAHAVPPMVVEAPAVADSDAELYAWPADILYGAGVSAVQTEGGWDADGKAESASDHVIDALPDVYRQSHKVAADSYHRYKEDVQMAADLKLQLYKFTISWARVLPTADASAPNQAGVDYYNNLINEILKHGMTPVATIYHFDHPQLLEVAFPGWQSRQMVDKFAEYAKFVFDTFGDRVPIFTTINEPNMYCAYFTTQFVAAGIRTADQVDPYQCMHNNVLAHQKAYQIYQDGKAQGKYRADGKVGISTLLMQAHSATGSPEDVYAADFFNALHAGTTLDPVIHGDYPQILKDTIGDKLPKFTDDEKAALAKGPTDFIGLNIYFGMRTAYNRFRNSSASGTTSMMLGQMSADMAFIDADIIAPAGSSGPLAAFTTIDPDVMKSGLLWTWLNYGKPVVITENGYGDLLRLGSQDTQRAAYHSAFLRSLVTTVKDYGVKVIAYCAWSLLDSWEFTAGYNRPFGLVKVDYESGSLARTLKDSKTFWWELAETKVVPYVPNQDDTTTAAPQTNPPTAKTNPPTAKTNPPTVATTAATPKTTPKPNGAAATAATVLPLAALAALLLGRAL